MEGQRRSKKARMTSRTEDDDRKDKQMTTRLQERRLREETFRHLRDVLNNHVVCENIASYLSLSDMKAASEVSRQFFQAIRGTRRFAQKAVLTITDKNLEDVKTFIRTTDYKYCGVKVDVTDPANILEDLRRVLKSAESVSLEQRPSMNEDRAVKDATDVSLLTAVLSSTPKLSQLKFDIGFFSSNVGGLLSSQAVQQTLGNLNRLDLLRMTEVKGHWRSWWRLLNSEEEDTFMRNLLLLAELPNRLKRFNLTQLFPMKEECVDSLHRSVLRLLRNNRATLEHLELHFIVWRIQELQRLTCPALKTLTASVDKNDGALGEFLKNQRSLEELTLMLTGWVNLGDPLYAGIKERSVGLKKLHLTMATVNFEELDWSFLTAMSRLKDFMLKMWGGFENGSGVLASLPKNQLECLRLEGLTDFWEPYGFWRLHEVDDKSRYKTELLEGFRCLRKLSFLDSPDAVDDELMQWLLKEFVSLEELQLSDCSMLTDAGITGNTTAEWGRDASFAELRRLKTLNIVECPGVTPDGVLESCVNVPSLRSLEYTQPRRQIVELLVLKLVEQNPRLERLTLDYDGDVEDLEKLKAKLKKKNPRVELLGGRQMTF